MTLEQLRELAIKCQRKADKVYPQDGEKLLWDAGAAILSLISAVEGSNVVEESDLPYKPKVYAVEVPSHCDRIVWRGKYIHLDNL